MRELAYAGFQSYLDETLVPTYRGKIPLVIKIQIIPDHHGIALFWVSFK